MTSRIEAALSKSAEMRDGMIAFQPVNRTKAPESAWIRFAYRGGVFPPVSFAGILGPLHPANEAGEFLESYEEWEELGKLLNKLLGSCLRDCPLKVAAMSTEHRQRVFKLLRVWTEQPSFHQLINNLIVSQDIHLSGTDPLSFGSTSPKGKILATAINQMLEARHALYCANCGDLFLLTTPRPSAFCSSACRKADHLKKHA